MMERTTCNRSRYVEGDPRGHYESYFQRANHPATSARFLDSLHRVLPKGTSRGRGG